MPKKELWRSRMSRQLKYLSKNLEMKKMVPKEYNNNRQEMYQCRMKDNLKLPKTKQEVLKGLEDPDFVTPDNMVIKTKGDVILIFKWIGYEMK